MVDVLIAGGGPGGTSAAIALAGLGAKVLLIDRVSFPRQRIGESLPPKVDPLLSAMGVREAVDEARFVRMRGTTVLQGVTVRRHLFDPSGEKLGYQVDRARFDLILLERARELGVEIWEGCPAVAPIIEDGVVRGAMVRDRGSEVRVEARFTIDATGGSAWLARALNLRRRESIRTVALTAYFSGGQCPPEHEAEDTFFEMLPAGWVWSVLRSDGLRNITVGVDASALKQRGADSNALYMSAVNASKLVAAICLGASSDGRIVGHDATWATSEEFIGPGWLLSGDSASVIDPLTSQGVFKAIQSGLSAAAVIHTILKRPADRALAERYYQRAQARLYANYVDVALTFYRASLWVGEPFWSTRIDDARRTVDAPKVSPEERLRRRESFLHLVRSSGGSGVTLRANPRLVLAPAPVIEGGWIVPRPALADGDDEILFPPLDPPVDGSVLLPLLDGRTLESLFEAYATRTGQERSSALGKSLFTALTTLAELELLLS